MTPSSSATTSQVSHSPSIRFPFASKLKASSTNLSPFPFSNYAKTSIPSNSSP
jgi:hypothetical protein